MSYAGALTNACKKKDLELLEIDGAYCFVKDKDGKIFPISEEIVASWIEK